jgi:ABC-type long-subunit fatty acid transport system fused permease/ATPase subunit
VVVDGMDDDLVAEAAAFGCMLKIAFSAQPASAFSYFFASKTALLPLASIHAPLPHDAALERGRSLASPAIPFVSMRQSRHSQLL